MGHEALITALEETWDRLDPFADRSTLFAAEAEALRAFEAVYEDSVWTERFLHRMAGLPQADAPPGAAAEARHVHREVSRSEYTRWAVLFRTWMYADFTDAELEAALCLDPEAICARFLREGRDWRLADRRRLIEDSLVEARRREGPAR